MGKTVAPKDDRPNVGKQNKFKIIIVYKKVQVKVRIINQNLKVEKINETSGYFEERTKSNSNSKEQD